MLTYISKTYSTFSRKDSVCHLSDESFRILSLHAVKIKRCEYEHGQGNPCNSNNNWLASALSSVQRHLATPYCNEKLAAETEMARVPVPAAFRFETVAMQNSKGNKAAAAGVVMDGAQKIQALAKAPIGVSRWKACK